MSARELWVAAAGGGSAEIGGDARRAVKLTRTAGLQFGGSARPTAPGGRGRSWR